MRYGKFAAVFIIAFLLTLFIPQVSAGYYHEFNDVLINGHSSISERLFEAVEGKDSVYIEVESDIKVNIYVISFTDWFSGFYGDSIRSYHDQTYASFSVDIPDHQDYYLVIENPNQESALVDYSYRVASDEPTTHHEMFCLICGGSTMLLIGVTALVVALVARSKIRKIKGLKKQ
ncbi:MAG: hypothetical protein U9R75_12865 [Candidatus Thermoplasmatota archaeon]|nr:hypothetical protein [Candidatus Thermoplasmatota archaeon]